MEKRYILTAVLVCFLLITTGIWWAGRNYKLPPISDEHEVRKGISLKNGDAVRVDGEIKRLSVTKTGMMFINLETRESVKLTVVSYPAMGKLPYIKRGDNLEVRGIVDHYRGNLQVIPYSRREIRLKGATRNIRSDITEGQYGQWI